jgi:hypothetical protein
MPEICSEIIPTPFSGAPDYHLMCAERGSAVESFVFIPQSDAPGLTIDLLRLDLLQRHFQRLQDMFEVLLSQLISYAGLERARCEIVSSSPTDIVFHFSFAGHPLAGAQHTIGRLIDCGNSICGIQVLRKIEALTSEEVSARLAFVRSVHVNLAVLQPRSGNITAFVKASLANSARVDAIFQRMSEEREAPDDLTVLQQALSQASPLHETIKWASLAKFAAVDILEEGRAEAFGAARRMLGLAALDLDDLRMHSGDDHFFLPKILNAIDPLAELLLYDAEGDRTAHVLRAAGIWRVCSEFESGGEPGRAAQFEVMGAFAGALAGMDLSAPLDAGLGHATTAALENKEQVKAIVAKLYATASRMAYIARRYGGDQALHLGSCLAADLAQFLVERATALGSLDFDTFIGESVRIAKWQLGAQMALFQLTQMDLDRGASELEKRAPVPRAKRPHLVYLRPLSTARRELLSNRFSADPSGPDGRYRLLPDRISIEAALQVALTPSFATQALGGPIDLFGMRRDTILGRGADSWQGMANLMIIHSDLILVLPADSEGLSWELGEILRQGAARKTIFVLPPRETEGAPAMSPAARERLGAIGYTLPERIEAGFFLLTADGNCDRHIPFDWLWDGRLNTELRARLHVGLR